MRLVAIAAFALIASGCKKEEPPAPVVLQPIHETPRHLAADDDTRPPKQDEKLPGGSDETEVNAHSADRAAREWLRAAKSDDILKLLRLSPALSDPASGATLDEDGQRTYYGKLLAASQDWTGELPKPVTADRVSKWAKKNKIDSDLRKAIASCNYVIAGEGGDDATAIFLRVYETKGDYYVGSAVEVPARGELP